MVRQAISRAVLLAVLIALGSAAQAALLEDVRFSNGPALRAAPVSEGVLTREIPRVAAPPVLDGELGELCWQQKQAYLGSFRLGLSPTLARHSREAWACYDERNLYLAVKLQRKPGQPLRVNTKRDDDGLIWEDDEIEMFFDPFGTGAEYYQIILNSGAYVFDATHRIVTVLDPAGASPTDTKQENLMDLAWTSGLQRKVAVRDDYWSAEVALPLAAIGLSGAPAGRGLRFNITSADWDTNEYTCLSPVSDWQDPRQFGALVLGKPQVAVVGLELGSVGQGRNQLRLQVRDLTGRASRQELCLRLKTARDEVTARQAYDLPANASQPVSLSFKTTAGGGPWSAEITLTEGGRALFAAHRAGETPEPLLLRLGSRGAFTGGSPVTVAAHLGLGPLTAREVELTAELLTASGQVLARQSLGRATGTHLAARLPLDTLEQGRYTLRLTATNGKETVATATATLLLAASPYEQQ